MRIILLVFFEDFCFKFICVNFEVLCFENIIDICGFLVESFSFRFLLFLYE